VGVKFAASIELSSQSAEAAARDMAEASLALTLKFDDASMAKMKAEQKLTKLREAATAPKVRERDVQQRCAVWLSVHCVR
jgi:uncharacterized protein YggE